MSRGRTTTHATRLAVLVSLLVSGAVHPMEPFPGAPAIEDSALERMRAGLDLGNGIFISFGFENLVYVNGELVSTTVFTLDPGMLAGVPSMVRFLRDGSAELAPADLTNLAVATIIQNALDAQTIQSLTVIDATVTNLDFVHTLRLDDVLGGQTLGFRP